MTIIDGYYVFLIKKSIALPIFFIFLIGSVIGSLTNVLIYRIPISIEINFIKDLFLNDLKVPKKVIDFYETNKNMSLFSASNCPICETKIKPWHNIPIIGFFILKGRCANCKGKISKQYPVIELITAISYAIIYMLQSEVDSGTIIIMISFSLLLSISLIDRKYYLIPDSLLYPFLFLGLLYNLSEGVDYYIYSIFLVTLTIFPFLNIYKKIRKINFIIGDGDTKLLIAISAWIGYEFTMITLIMGCISGIAEIVIRKKREIAFGPHLAMALLVFLMINNFNAF